MASARALRQSRPDPCAHQSSGRRRWERRAARRRHQQLPCAASGGPRLTWTRLIVSLPVRTSQSGPGILVSGYALRSEGYSVTASLIVARRCWGKSRRRLPTASKRGDAPVVLLLFVFRRAVRLKCHQYRSNIVLDQSGQGWSKSEASQHRRCASEMMSAARRVGAWPLPSSSDFGVESAAP